MVATGISSPKHVEKSTGNCSQQDVVEKRDRDRERLLEDFSYTDEKV